MSINYQNTPIVALLMVAMIAMTGPAAADEKRVEMNYKLGVGAQYDGNVVVADQDAGTGEQDSVIVYDAGIGAKIALTDPLSIRLGYDFSASKYQQFSEFDLGLHHGVAELSYAGKHLGAAVSVEQIEAVLDGDGYLSMTQVSPSISRLFGTRLFVRGAFNTAEKTYDDLPERNADTAGYRVDAYVLFDGMQHYLSVGMQSNDEDAVGADYDFDSVQAMAGYGFRLQFPEMALDLKAQLRLEQRDYITAVDAAGALREDRRLRMKVSAGIPFTDHITLQGEVEYTDNVSNVIDVSLNKYVYGVKLTAAF